LRSAKQSCDGLSSRVQALNSQAIAANSSGGGGDLCNQITRAQTQTQSLSPPSSGSSIPTSNHYDPYNCVQNPSSMACKGLTEVQTNLKGKSGYQAADKKHSPKIDELMVFPTSYSDTPKNERPINQAISAHGIPNNSPDGLPPAPSGSGLEDVSTAGNRARGSNADILQASTRSGGGYSNSGTNQTAEQNFTETNRGPSGEASEFFGLDLKNVFRIGS
ncbi:MAG: hypothetical protein ACXVA9_08135, partial [Bdellovibrionales bacterium]